MKFIEHGIFEIKIEENILLVDATGPFNEELIINYQNALESCIKSLEHKKWNQIITLHQLSVFTPEAELALTKTLINRKSRGLTHCAVVIGDTNYKALLTEQMSRCYCKAEIDHQYFNTLDTAKKWINTPEQL